jgi:putative two-component system response regulator
VDRRVKENRVIHDLALNMITSLSKPEYTIQQTISHAPKLIEILAGHLRKMDKYRDVLTDERLDNIISASALHDIGKIGIPDSILLKPGKLTAEEFEQMKAHCRIGGEAIRSAMEKVRFKDMRDGSDSTPASYLFLRKRENSDLPSRALGRIGVIRRIKG